MPHIDQKGLPQAVTIPTPPVQPSVQTLHMGRKLNFFSVSESEVELIGLVSRWATFFFALGSFCLALIGPDLLAAFIDSHFGKQLSPDEARRLLLKGIIIGTPTVVSYAVGILMVLNRKFRWQKIRRESFKR